MSSKEGLCLWCGRFTENRALDGMADCNRLACVIKREYVDEFDMKGGKKEVNLAEDGSIDLYDTNGELVISFPLGDRPDTEHQPADCPNGLDKFRAVADQGQCPDHKE